MVDKNFLQNQYEKTSQIIKFYLEVFLFDIQLYNSIKIKYYTYLNVCNNYY